MRDLVDPKFRDQFDSYLRQIASAGEAAGILAVLTRTGQRRLWEYHCTLRTEGVDKPVVRGIAHDITDRIAAEKALSESNKKLAETATSQELYCAVSSCFGPFSIIRTMPSRWSIPLLCVFSTSTKDRASISAIRAPNSSP